MVLTELQKEDIKSHMLTEEDALKIKYKAKNNEFDTIKVLHGEVEAYEKKGFIKVGSSKLKTSMTKKKLVGTQFEDDIWCMFYKLGFRILNADEKLVIPWGPNEEDRQQIDVVAVGNDAIFVIECKAAETPRSQSFKKEINNIIQYKDGVANTLIQLYGKKRVKFIFATRNYRIQEDGEDALRMRDNKIYHLNDNTYQYLNGLIKSYKGTVSYQFHGLMFKDEIISNKKITIPALKGQMGGRDYYLFSIEPDTLLKIGFVLHRTRVNDSLAPTYQRLLVPSRLNGITKFINDGGYFPNSIIVNFSASRDSLKVNFTPIEGQTDTKAQFGYLDIPNAYGIAYIIDGQHRVYGYANSDYKTEHTIPVVAFDDMASEEQLKIFMDINENQKAVSPSLRLDLQEDLYWKSERVSSRMVALRSSVIKALAGNVNNVLYNKISVGEDGADLTFKPFDTALSHSGLIPKATASQYTGDTDTCLYNVKETNLDKEMRESRTRIMKFIDGCYSILDESLTEEAKSDFLFSNRATYALITLMGSLHSFLIKSGELQPTSGVQERIAAITPYLKSLAENLNSMDEDQKSVYKGALGQGADTFWLRSFQDLINKAFPDYNPEQLTQWRETQDKGIQEEGKRLKGEIRDLLRNVFFKLLQETYGIDWKKNITKLELECKNRIVKAHGEDDGFDLNDYDWEDWIELSDYKEYIDKNFSNDNFASAFTINYGNNPKTKKEKLSWLSTLEEAKGKNKVVTMTRSDVNKLWLILEHLSNCVEPLE